MFGVLFSYASIIFGQFYFGESMEPRKTRIIKFLRKLSILQRLKQLIDRQTETHPFCFCYFILYLFFRVIGKHGYSVNADFHQFNLYGWYSRISPCACNFNLTISSEYYVFRQPPDLLILRLVYHVPYSSWLDSLNFVRLYFTTCARCTLHVKFCDYTCTHIRYVFIQIIELQLQNLSEEITLVHYCFYCVTE